MPYTTTGTIHPNTIIQSGTDMDLSGLSTVLPASDILSDPTGDFVLYVMRNNRLVITGTQHHDPEKEVLYFTPDLNQTPSTLCIGNQMDRESDGPVLTGTYHYGVETTVDGRTRYSTGAGIIISVVDTSTNPSRGTSLRSIGGLYLNHDGSMFFGRGGTIITGRGIGIYDGAGLDCVAETLLTLQQSAFDDDDRPRELRFNARADLIPPGSFRATCDGFTITHRNTPPTFGPVLSRGNLSQLAGGGQQRYIPIRDIDTSNNIDPRYDFGLDDLLSGGNPPTKFLKFYQSTNGVTGSLQRCMPRDGVSDNRHLGGLYTFQEIQFTISDPDGATIEAAEIYMIDTDNGFRKNANEEDNLADNIYTATTNASGESGTITVTTSITNVDSVGPGWAYTDWDTTNLSNRFKVDRRGLDDSGNDIFSFFFISYLHVASQSNQALKGPGQIEVAWTLFADPTISETNRTVVDAYASIDNAAQLYDCAKSYLVRNYTGQLTTMVSRIGDQIDAGAFDVSFDPSATDTFAVSGNTITVKSSEFDGSLLTTGTVTLASGVTITGSIIDSTGTNVPLGVTVTDFTDGSVLVGARVWIRLADNTVLMNQITDSTGSATVRATITPGDQALLRVRSASTDRPYLDIQRNVTITGNGLNESVSLIRDF